MKPKNAAPADSRRDWNAHQRGGWIVLCLWQGAKLSNKDAARLTGITRRGAQYMMETLSATFPIVFVGGFWQWMDKDE
jgi:hypothetical protein